MFFQRINILSSLFYTKKAQKAHKKHKNAKKRISDFFLLRCFLSTFKTVFFVGFNKLVKVGIYGLTVANLLISKLLLSSFFCLKNKTALIPSFMLLLKCHQFFFIIKRVLNLCVYCFFPLKPLLVKNKFLYVKQTLYYKDRTINKTKRWL